MIQLPNINIFLYKFTIMNNDIFDDKGNRKTDFIDGITITTVMLLLIAGIIYYLYTI